MCPAWGQVCSKCNKRNHLSRCDDQVDVRHRMDIAQAVFGSLSHLWTDHRLSWETKGTYYPEGSIFSDCELENLQDIIDTATNRSGWRAKVASLT